MKGETLTEQLSSIQIRAIRKSVGLTQAQLASVMGVKQPTVSLWETGDAAPASTALRLLIAYRDGYRPEDWPEGE